MRIIVGMSGGVDSSLTAALLKKQGHDVIGVTLQLYSYEESLEEVDPQKKNCHPSAFIRDAQRVCSDLGIPHHLIDQQALFQSRIIHSFMKDYQEGRTPLPCAKCNKDVKSAVLYGMMQDLSADALATGHYVRRIEVDGMVQLHQGQDVRRDQSFFLFALEFNQLVASYFPLGHHSKEETRAQAADFGLNVALTPASQDLCFIAKKSYKTLFTPRPGEIHHIDGRLMGKHEGMERYTIGQRQGLGIGGATDPLYVVRLDASENRVIVGPKENLARTSILLKDVNWIAPDKKESQYDLSVKIRSSGRAMPARINLNNAMSEASVILAQPDYAVSPGQACVFYDGTRVLGGGWIESAS